MPRRSLAVDRTLTLLAENPPRIAELTAGLSPAQLRAIPGPDEWSANDVLAHLRCCADVWGGGIRTMIDQESPTIRAVSPRGWIKRTNYLDLEFAPSLHAFVAQRADLLALLDPLSAMDWSRTATVRNSGKAQTWTMLSYVERLANHEQQHLDQFARIADAVR